MRCSGTVCHLLLIAAVATTWAAALIASFALYLDLYVVEGNLQDTDGMKVHERMPSEHFQVIIYYGHHNLPDLFSSYGSTDPGLSNWAILTSAHGNCPACGMLFTCQQMCRILLAWGGKMQKTRDNSLTLQIEDSWRNGYELAANSYCCCIASDCRFRLLVFSLYYVWSSFWNDRAGWKGNSLSGNR